MAKNNIKNKKSNHQNFSKNDISLIITLSLLFLCILFPNTMFSLIAAIFAFTFSLIYSPDTPKQEKENHILTTVNLSLVIAIIIAIFFECIFVYWCGWPMERIGIISDVLTLSIPFSVIINESRKRVEMKTTGRIFIGLILIFALMKMIQTILV